jgi:hypothetical protein
MATYIVTTEKGKFKVTTEDAQQPAQQSQPAQPQPQGIDRGDMGDMGAMLGSIAGPLGTMAGRRIAGGGQAGYPEERFAGQLAGNIQGGIPEMLLNAAGGQMAPPSSPQEQMADVSAFGTSIMAPSSLLIPKVTAKAGQLMRWDNVLTQARKSKVAIDSLRTNLGKAKEIALKEIENVPAKLNWGKNVSQKITNAIQNPIYGIEFTDEGVKGTIGNLDKVKEALYDILSSKDFVEASKIEKRQIISFARGVRDTILDAAQKVGKPQLAKALKDYHNFMNNYSVVNSKLVDKFGNALGNKLKDTFRFTAEPAVKEAWKELGKSSPELKKIISSRKNRELIKALVKISPVAGGGALALKKLVD